jgi:hypothetical protein
MEVIRFMKAEIKSHMIVDDFLVLPKNYIPYNKMHFIVGFTFNIGPIGENKSEIFDVKISNKFL